MDERTLSWYDSQSVELAARYESAVSPLAGYIQRVLRPGGRVLDIGCGSGRDLAVLLAAGFDAWGLEPSMAMLDRARVLHPDLKDRLFSGGLPDTGLSGLQGFDAIICMASFMHVPRALMPTAALAIQRLLTANGRLILSVPLNRTGLDAEAREVGGRLFSPLTSSDLQALFSPLGFVLLETHETGDALCRDDVRWLTQIFELRAGHSD